MLSVAGPNANKRSVIWPIDRVAILWLVSARSHITQCWTNWRQLNWLKREFDLKTKFIGSLAAHKLDFRNFLKSSKVLTLEFFWDLWDGGHLKNIKPSTLEALRRGESAKAFGGDVPLANSNRISQLSIPIEYPDGVCQQRIASQNKAVNSEIRTKIRSLLKFRIQTIAFRRRLNKSPPEIGNLMAAVH